MKRIPEKSRKRTGWVRAIDVGLGMVVIAWGTPSIADTGPDDTSGWFSPRTQPTSQIAADPRHDGMNILLARGGGGGQGKGGGKGRGQGSGQCDGSGSGQGQGKGYGAKDGTGTGERPRDGSGSGAGSGRGSGGGSGNNDGSGSKGNNRGEWGLLFSLPIRFSPEAKIRKGRGSSSSKRIPASPVTQFHLPPFRI